MALFSRASRRQSRLRMALVGPSGSGKTFSSLAIAAELAASLGGDSGSPGRIAVIDTERGSASKYACQQFQFDVLELAQFDPRSYIEAIEAAEQEGYKILIIDSLTHAWSGKGGALELVDKAAKRSKSNNTFTAWRDVTPLHNALVDAMIGSGCHIIATMRSKVDYVMETDPNTGKQMPKKVGMAPIQREGMDYEFDVVGDIDLDHNLAITKTRCAALDGDVINKPGRKFAMKLVEWLSDGAPAVQQVMAPSSLPRHMIDAINELVAETGTTEHQLRSALARRGVSKIEHLTEEDASGLIQGLEGAASKIRAEAATANGIGDQLMDVMNGEAASNGVHRESTEDASDIKEQTADDHVIPETTRTHRGEEITA